MPPTEQCPLGAENKANIENLDGRLTEFKSDVRRYMERMDKNIEKLTNHYSARPSWFITILITALVGLCVGLAQYCITTGRKNEPRRNTQPITTTTERGQEKTPGPP